MRRTLMGALALVLAAGCRTTPPVPVHLEGDPASLARLVGTWTGQYWGGAGGRGGSLAFALRAGSDSLYGDVTMIDPRGETIRPADPSGVHAMHVASPQQLRIDFVAAQADSIRGVLEPYIGPDCQCTVSTTFFGQVRGDDIKGTFVSRTGGRVRAEGQWEVKRVGDAK